MYICTVEIILYLHTLCIHSLALKQTCDFIYVIVAISANYINTRSTKIPRSELLKLPNIFDTHIFFDHQLVGITNITNIFYVYYEFIIFMFTGMGASKNNIINENLPKKFSFSGGLSAYSYPESSPIMLFLINIYLFSKFCY